MDGGSQISPSPIDFHRRPYTLSHYRASVWFTVFLYFSFYYILVVNCVCQLFNNDQWRCWWWWWQVFWHMRTNRHTDTLITVLRSNNSEPAGLISFRDWYTSVGVRFWTCMSPSADPEVRGCTMHSHAIRLNSHRILVQSPYNLWQLWPYNVQRDRVNSGFKIRNEKCFMFVKNRHNSTSAHLVSFNVLIVSIFLSLYSVCMYFVLYYLLFLCLQCFDAVGWAAGRTSGL